MNEQSMATYRSLLVEIKHRTEAIDLVLNLSLNMRARIAEELCYLQLRLICETIAIGCLVIHGGVSGRKRDLLKSYKADWIISQLAALHPRFYPQPLEREDDKSGEIPSWNYMMDGYLTQQELILLYNRISGDKLHRGSVRNLTKKEHPDFSAIQVWRDKVVKLLTRHIVVSPDEETLCYFVMNNGKNEVASNLFKAVYPMPSSNLP